MNPLSIKQSPSPPSTEHPFAQYVRILGKGKSGTRALTRDEAKDAFSLIMRGEVEPLQLGAFLMLLRVKEETAEELTGFVEACRENMNRPANKVLSADLDWSSYAGKKNQHPWYILSILLLTQAGHRIFIHGSSGHTAGRLYTEQALSELGLPVAEHWDEVEKQLDSTGMSYLPLRCFCKPLDELLQLRPLLGLRSPVNTLARLLNPLGAPHSLQSIFHPAYGALHQQADLLLQQPRALVFKGESGEIEIKPQADTKLLFLHKGEMTESLAPRTIQGRVANVEHPETEAVRQLWEGETNDNDDFKYGLEATLATTAASLTLLNPSLNMKEARTEAKQLWQARDRGRLS